MINEPLLFLPTCISSIIEASISLNRCAKFIYTDELDDKYLKEIYLYDNAAIEFKNSNFIWTNTITDEIQDKTKVEDTETRNIIILKDLNLSFEKGKVVAIIGDVWCGKTSLL